MSKFKILFSPLVFTFIIHTFLWAQFQGDGAEVIGRWDLTISEKVF